MVMTLMSVSLKGRGMDVEEEGVQNIGSREEIYG